MRAFYVGVGFPYGSITRERHRECEANSRKGSIWTEEALDAVHTSHNGVAVGPAQNVIFCSMCYVEN